MSGTASPLLFSIVYHPLDQYSIHIYHHLKQKSLNIMNPIGLESVSLVWYYSLSD